MTGCRRERPLEYASSFGFSRFVPPLSMIELSVPHSKGKLMSDAEFQRQLDILDSQQLYKVQRISAGAIITLLDGRDGVVILRPAGRYCEILVPTYPIRRAEMLDVAHAVERLLQ